MGASHVNHKRTYWIIFAVLGVLTVLELFVPDMNATKMVKGSLLVFLASVKAFCVAYWYMHLNEETKWLKFIAAIPISAAVYALVVSLESVYR